MLWDERRYCPLSLWARSHVRSGGRSTDEGDGRDLMMVLLQDLAIEMNGEQFRARAHSNQMPADVVMGTNCYIWEKGRDGTNTGRQHSDTCWAPATHRHCAGVGSLDTLTVVPTLEKQMSKWWADEPSWFIAVRGTTEVGIEPRDGGCWLRNGLLSDRPTEGTE